MTEHDDKAEPTTTDSPYDHMNLPDEYDPKLASNFNHSEMRDWYAAKAKATTDSIDLTDIEQVLRREGELLDERDRLRERLRAADADLADASMTLMQHQATSDYDTGYYLGQLSMEHELRRLQAKLHSVGESFAAGEYWTREQVEARVAAAEAERCPDKTYHETYLGVGSGGGNLYVGGSQEATKVAQDKLFRMERAEEQVRSLIAERQQVTNDRLEDLRALLRALGMHDGAQARTPQAVFEEAIVNVRQLREQVEQLTTQLDSRKQEPL
jgi:hypothetical protein